MIESISLDQLKATPGHFEGYYWLSNANQPKVCWAGKPLSETGLITQAVGLITHALQADEIVRNDQADLTATGREALSDPHWALHAAEVLGVDPEFENWPVQYGWWMVRRARSSEFYQPPAEDSVAAE